MIVRIPFAYSGYLTHQPNSADFPAVAIGEATIEALAVPASRAPVAMSYRDACGVRREVRHVDGGRFYVTADDPRATELVGLPATMASRRHGYFGNDERRGPVIDPAAAVRAGNRFDLTTRAAVIASLARREPDDIVAIDGLGWLAVAEPVVHVYRYDVTENPQELPLARLRGKRAAVALELRLADDVTATDGIATLNSSSIFGICDLEAARAAAAEHADLFGLPVHEDVDIRTLEYRDISLFRYDHKAVQRRDDLAAVMGNRIDVLARQIRHLPSSVISAWTAARDAWSEATCAIDGSELPAFRMDDQKIVCAADTFGRLIDAELTAGTLEKTDAFRYTEVIESVTASPAPALVV